MNLQLAAGKYSSLKQDCKQAIAMTELKGLKNTYPCQNILLNAFNLKKKPKQVRKLYYYLSI
jgi:hypothetical protein